MKKVPYNIYTDQFCFEREVERIFKKSWLLACTWPEISDPNSFVLVKTTFGEIIVTSKSDEPVAFYNKCLHRGHKLTEVDRGNCSDNFTCPYHGWVYDVSGKLVKIPGGAKFYGPELSLFEKKESIQPLAVKRFGDFIFVNADNEPSEIYEQFEQSVMDGIELTKDKIGKTFLHLAVELPFNWKLIFENLRDGLHPLFLHQNSLNEEVDFFFASEYVTTATRPITKISQMSSFSRDGKLRKSESDHKKHFQLIDSGEHYLNWLLFPYTHIASPDGAALIGVENYVPMSANKTRFELRLHITKRVGQASEIPILHRWLSKAKKVFEEDFDAVVSIQSNASNSAMHQNIGEYELFNADIHKWFEDYIYG